MRRASADTSREGEDGMTSTLTTIETAPPRFSRDLRILYAVSGLSGLAMGLFTPLVSTLMESRGYAAIWIGALSTIYYACQAAASPLVDRAMRRIGARRSILSGLLLASTSAALFPWAQSAGWMVAARAATALGVALYLIGGQTALMALSDESNRARVAGRHSLSFAVGLAMGPVAGVSLYQVSPALAFLAGGACIAAGVPLVWLGMTRAAPPPDRCRMPVMAKLRVPLHAIFAYGFAEAALFAVFPVFLLRQGFGVEHIGGAFSAFVLGSIASALPVTALGDRFGRVKMLAVITGVGVIAMALLIAVRTTAALVALSALAGATAGPIYALALALVGDALTEKERPSGNALFTAAFSVGCIAGPLLTSLAMNQFGHASLFGLTAALFAILLVHISLHASQSSMQTMARSAWTVEQG
jgi:MFS family permease